MKRFQANAATASKPIPMLETAVNGSAKAAEPENPAHELAQRDRLKQFIFDQFTEIHKLREAFLAVKQTQEQRLDACRHELEKQAQSLDSRLSDLGERETRLAQLQSELEEREQLLQAQEAAFCPPPMISSSDQPDQPEKESLAREEQEAALEELRAQRDTALAGLQNFQKKYQRLAKQLDAARIAARRLPELQPEALPDLAAADELLRREQENLELHKREARLEQRMEHFHHELVRGRQELMEQTSILTERRRNLEQEQKKLAEQALELRDAELRLSDSELHERELKAEQESVHQKAELIEERLRIAQQREALRQEREGKPAPTG